MNEIFTTQMPIKLYLGMVLGVLLGVRTLLSKSCLPFGAENGWAHSYPGYLPLAWAPFSWHYSSMTGIPAFAPFCSQETLFPRNMFKGHLLTPQNKMKPHSRIALFLARQAWAAVFTLCSWVCWGPISCWLIQQEGFQGAGRELPVCWGMGRSWKLRVTTEAHADAETVPVLRSDAFHISLSGWCSGGGGL